MCDFTSPPSPWPPFHPTLPGLDFDIALRLFMDAFRVPGEGQKIDRIVQAFGNEYHRQVSWGGALQLCG
jgi:hypothetical protein